MNLWSLRYHKFLLPAKNEKINFARAAQQKYTNYYSWLPHLAVFKAPCCKFYTPTTYAKCSIYTCTRRYTVCMQVSESLQTLMFAVWVMHFRFTNLRGNSIFYLKTHIRTHIHTYICNVVVYLCKYIGVYFYDTIYTIHIHTNTYNMRHTTTSKSLHIYTHTYTCKHAHTYLRCGCIWSLPISGRFHAFLLPAYSFGPNCPSAYLSDCLPA